MPRGTDLFLQSAHEREKKIACFKVDNSGKVPPANKSVLTTSCLDAAQNMAQGPVHNLYLRPVESALHRSVA